MPPKRERRRSWFDPSVKTNRKGAYTVLEETKGQKFEDGKFVDNFESAAENLKKYSASISKKSN